MPRHSQVTPDGSPVAVYLGLDAEPEFTPVLEAIRPPASVLDLGCGVGRLANELARRGFEVSGVDESAAMLAHVDPAVERVEQRIETLELGRAFDAVVLASHFVNVADPGSRRALLATAARHLRPGGVAFVQHWTPLDARELTGGEGEVNREVNGVHVSFRVRARRGQTFDGEVTYALGASSWTQAFTATVLDEDGLDGALAGAGLRRRERLSPTWLAAERAG